MPTVRQIFLSTIVGACTLGATSLPNAFAAQTSCDVRGLYKGVEVPSGALGLFSGGSTEELDAVLVPTTIGAGSYDVTVTRKASDLYEVSGRQVYIRTFACYEFAFSKGATLRYAGGNYIGAGKLTFQ